MSFLHVYHEADGEQPLLSTHEGERIAAELTAIRRLFTNTEGWVANMTGSPIASRFPRFEILCGDRVA